MKPTARKTFASVLRGLAWGVGIAAALYAVALWLLFRPLASSVGDGLADVIDNEPAGVADPATSAAAPAEDCKVIDPELEQILQLEQFLHEPILPALALDWREAAITDLARVLEAASPRLECLADGPSGGRIRIAVSPPRLGEKSFGTNEEPRVSLVPSGNAPDRRFSLLELASLATCTL